MTLSNISLTNEEEAAFLLRSLFRQYGYSQYKMSKFEEYDLYVRNKDFLISDSIITFTDTNGKLMALKPDVTLSIVKNSDRDSDVLQKVYYDENVYRVSSGTNSFKELMQVGIECIGPVDDYCLYEVLMLAAKSLKTLSSDAVLDLSHFGMVSDLIASFDLKSDTKRKILSLIGEKNLHELSRFCKECGLSKEREEVLIRLVSTYGKPETVLPLLSTFLTGYVPKEELALLEKICKQLSENGFGDMLRIDFSVVNHNEYYNGIVFKGFIKGVPTGVLSGGQYDRLMQKMGQKSRAVGFAVYMDLLQANRKNQNDYDVDAILLYDDTLSLDLVEKAVKDLMNQGKCVMTQKVLPEKITCREVFRITESGVTLLERYA